MRFFALVISLALPFWLVILAGWWFWGYRYLSIWSWFALVVLVGGAAFGLLIVRHLLWERRAWHRLDEARATRGHTDY